MSDPLVPNYKQGVGRLVTDRFDFEKHVNGTDFRHKAGQIDLFPTLVVNSVSVTTVQEALAAFVDVITPPTIHDATSSVKGILKLTGDFAGTADLPKVVAIQGKPISTLTPNNGDVLTWNSGLSTWQPSAATNAFSPAGDLGGNNVLQNVIGWSGQEFDVSVGKVVRGSNNVVSYINSATPLITQDGSTVNHGANLILRAQSTTGSAKNGGNAIVAGGAPGSGGLRGGVKLQLTAVVPVGYPQTSLSGIGLSNMLQATEVAINRRVLSLCNPNDLTTLDMPANTGDMVLYIRNAATVPSSGAPSNGAILYADLGQLWVKQQDGNQFAVGSIPNPSVWGASGQQTYTSRNYLQSFSGSASLAFTFSLPDNTATRADVILIGKANGSNNSAQFNLSMGYTRHGGSAPAAVGTLTNADPRNTAGASGWTVPNITVSGNTLQVFTGYSPSVAVTWLVVTQLTMSQG